MSIKIFEQYSVRLCAALMVVGAILLPVQAAVSVPLPVIKPLVSLELSVISYDSGMKRRIDIPVPVTKPGISQRSSTAQRKPLTASDAYIKLASFPSTAMVQEEKSVTSEPAYRSAVPAYAPDLTTDSKKPLSAKQSKLYEKLFTLQRQGRWDDADAVIDELQDRRLMGHVLYQRYMHLSYISQFDELKIWLSRYGDHPKADNIYKLANAKRNGRTDAINNPGKKGVLAEIKEPTIYYPKHYISKIRRTKSQAAQAQALTRTLYSLVRRGKASEASKKLLSLDPQNSALAYMDKVEIDHLKAEIAAIFLYRGRLSQAMILAKEASARSGRYVPLASWVMGLALWEKQDFAAAAPHFEEVGRSPYASGWRASAGYYWAARSYSRLSNHRKVRECLEKTAQHSRTFYGLIATRMLNKPFDFNWENPTYTKENEHILSETQAGRRAFLLVAAGQYDLAEEELMGLDYSQRSGLRRAALNYAMHVGLPGLALRLGNRIPSETGRYYDSALYPDAPWEPKKGFKLDPALIYAVMRQESRFDHEAKSNSGALGLMQVMPTTASYVARKNRYGYHVGKTTLKDPAINMMLGQDYLTYLLKGRIVQGDMISLLVAYNAGPGNLAKWRKRFEDNMQAQQVALNKSSEAITHDPLLFIETLPVEETRDYVAKVLSNYWIYRLRAGEELVSLLNLVKGQSPRYASFIGEDTAQPYMVANR